MLEKVLEKCWGKKIEEIVDTGDSLVIILEDGSQIKVNGGGSDFGSWQALEYEDDQVEVRQDY